ncbi:heavy metal translocating P-type ATPase, partial [Methylopila musalis]
DAAPALASARARTAPDASTLFPDAPDTWNIRVSRIGDTLSTWRVRREGEDQARFAHPALLWRRDLAFRLEEELAAIAGVEDFRASPLTGGVSVRFDAGLLSAERLARELEAAWPRLLDGLDGPPAPKRLAVSVGLLGLSAASQIAVPALRPVAVAALALYGAPNVVLAARQARHGQIGLPALYSAGLGFLLITASPLGGSIMAVFMQFWPELVRRTIVARQRRLFAGQRRRPVWARIPQPNGLKLEVHVDDLRPGDIIIVGRGEVAPADGVVEQGLAVIADETAFGHGRPRDVTKGDLVHAGARVTDGAVALRVSRAGAATSAAHVARALPHAPFVGLPSSAQAEIAANRNAKPALALAAVSLAVTRTLRPSQATIRPDYATAPRFSAQLSALRDFAEALDEGVLFRRPAALDQIADADLFVFDDTPGLGRRQAEVARVAARAATEDEVLAYAA